MKDITLDNELDLYIRNGDLDCSDATYQHEKCILLAEKGHYREFPFVGIGLQGYLLDDDFSPLPEEIQRQYELDGMIIRDLQVFTDGSIKTDVYYQGGDVAEALLRVVEQGEAGQGDGESTGVGSASIGGTFQIA